MLRYLPEVASKVKSQNNRERRTAFFMNKLRIIALVGVCFFCLSVIIGTVAPFYAEAFELEEQSAFSIDSIDFSAQSTAAELKEEKVEFETVTRGEEIP